MTSSPGRLTAAPLPAKLHSRWHGTRSGTTARFSPPRRMGTRGCGRFGRSRARQRAGAATSSPVEIPQLVLVRGGEGYFRAQDRARTSRAGRSGAPAGSGGAGRRAAHVPRTASRQHQELERKHGRPVRAARAYPGERARHFAMLERRKCAGGRSVLRQRGSNRVARGVVVSEAVRVRLLHDRADASAHLLRGNRLCRPNRQQDAHHVRGCDVAHTSGADSRHRLVSERRMPLLRRLAAVLPSRRVHVDDLVGGLGERRYNRVGRAVGSPPARATLRLSAAASRASARLTCG